MELNYHCILGTCVGREFSEMGKFFSCMLIMDWFSILLHLLLQSVKNVIVS